MESRPLSESDVVAEGRAVVLAWPTPQEVQATLQLWKRPYVNRTARFPFQPDASDVSTWFLLRFGIGVPYRATLAIRFRPDGRWLGTIGWTGWDPQTRRVWVGDLALDYGTLKAVARQFPASYAGVAVDAVTALTDYLFGSMGVETVETFIAEANVLAQRVALRAGFREVRRFLCPVSDGPPVPAVAFRKTRSGTDADGSGAPGVGGKQQHPGGMR